MAPVVVIVLLLLESPQAGPRPASLGREHGDHVESAGTVYAYGSTRAWDTYGYVIGHPPRALVLERPGRPRESDQYPAPAAAARSAEIKQGDVRPPRPRVEAHSNPSSFFLRVPSAPLLKQSLEQVRISFFTIDRWDLCPCQHVVHLSHHLSCDKGVPPLRSMSVKSQPMTPPSKSRTPRGDFTIKLVNLFLDSLPNGNKL